MSTLRATVIEDSAPLGLLYSQMLKSMNFEVDYFESGQLGLENISQNPPDILLLDLELPDIHGLDLLKELSARGLSFPRIVITGHSSIKTAVESMRLGANDFIEKPFSLERLQTTVDNLLRNSRLAEEVRILREQIERDGYAGFVGRSLPMQVVYRIIDSAATSKASVFITGESGTGKELCAQAIHDRSDRASGPFVAVNCGAIPKDLFESEIFGHVKGAFSGATADRTGAAEQADGGTLFLDEIGEMSLDQQVKLLRFIQTGTIQRIGSNKTQKVNVRFVCATNQDPLLQTQAGSFREDLYYRLNVIPINMPALRDRDDDVISIASSLLHNFSEQEGRNFLTFSAEVKTIFEAYRWPGNVRQLSNVVHNIVLLNDAEIVEANMLPKPLCDFEPDKRVPPAANVRPPENNQPTEMTTTTSNDALEPLWITEKRSIEHAIDRCGGNVPVAAAHLGVSASTLYRKIKHWDEEVVNT